MDLRKRVRAIAPEIDWLTGIKSLDAAIVIVALEGSPKGSILWRRAIHTDGFQSVAKRGVFFLRNAGIYANGHIRYRATDR